MLLNTDGSEAPEKRLQPSCWRVTQCETCLVTFETHDFRGVLWFMVLKATPTHANFELDRRKWHSR